MAGQEDEARCKWPFLAFIHVRFWNLRGIRHACESNAFMLILFRMLVVFQLIVFIKLNKAK